MKKITLTFVILVILGFATRKSLEAADGTSNIHGTWLTISFSESFKQRHDKKYDYPLEKHIMVFFPNGEWRRYSHRMGWKRMLLEYKLENGKFFARPFDTAEYKELGQYIAPDQLKIIIQPSHMITYKRVNHELSFEEIVLDGEPAIE